MRNQDKISLLWIVVMFNMAFADILSFMNPKLLGEIASGEVGGITITPSFLLLAAMLIEIPILMIILTQILRIRTARLLNLTAAIITTLFVIGGGSLMPHYIFFASIEVIAMLFIGYLAWGWRDVERA